MFEKCVCASACTQKTPNLRCRFLERRLTNTPRRHRLADGQLSSLSRPSCRWPALITLPTLAKFQLVWHRLCDIVLFRSSCLFEHTLVYYPSISLSSIQGAFKHFVTIDPKCLTILVSFWNLQKDERLSMPHPQERRFSRTRVKTPLIVGRYDTWSLFVVLRNMTEMIHFILGSSIYR